MRIRFGLSSLVDHLLSFPLHCSSLHPITQDCKNLKGEMEVSGAYISFLGHRSQGKWSRPFCLEITSKTRALVVAADTERSAKVRSVCVCNLMERSNV
jgi:hypothetical protein